MNDNYIKRYASEDYVAEEVGKLNTAIADKLDAPATAQVGQTFRVSEVDENDRVTKVEAVYETQADWNQNDETAKDYVNGRTHYAKNIEQPQTSDFSGVMGLGEAFVEGGDLVAGDIVQCVFDNVSYSLTARTFQGSVYVGNGDMLSIFGGSSDGVDTEVPFMVLDTRVACESEGMPPRWAVFPQTVGTHSFEWDNSYTEIIKLDRAYLPFDIKGYNSNDETVEIVDIAIADKCYNSSIENDIAVLPVYRNPDTGKLEVKNQYGLSSRRVSVSTYGFSEPDVGGVKTFTITVTYSYREIATFSLLSLSNSTTGDDCNVVLTTIGDEKIGGMWTTVEGHILQVILDWTDLSLSESGLSVPTTIRRLL